MIVNISEAKASLSKLGLLVGQFSAPDDLCDEDEAINAMFYGEEQ